MAAAPCSKCEIARQGCGAHRSECEKYAKFRAEKKKEYQRRKEKAEEHEAIKESKRRSIKAKNKSVTIRTHKK